MAALTKQFGFKSDEKLCNQFFLHTKEKKKIKRQWSCWPFCDVKGVSLCWVLSQKSWLLVKLTHTEITRRSKVMNSKNVQFVTQSHSKDTRIQMLFVWNHHFQMGKYHCLVNSVYNEFPQLNFKKRIFLHLYVLLHSVMIFVKTVFKIFMMCWRNKIDEMKQKQPKKLK